MQKTTVADRLAQIAEDFRRGRRQALSPKDLAYYIEHLPSLEEDQQEVMQKTVSLLPLSPRQQLEVARAHPDWVPMFTDITPQVQTHMVRNNQQIPELISRLPTLQEVSLALIRKAATHSSTEPDVYRHLLTHYDQQLRGLNLRKRVLTANPETVKALPKTVVLTRDEQMALINQHPEAFPDLQPEVPVADAYYRKQQTEEEHMEDVNELLHDLKVARAARQTLKIKKLEEKIERIKSALNEALPSAPPEESEDKTAISDLTGKALGDLLVLMVYPCPYGKEDLPSTLERQLGAVSIPYEYNQVLKVLNQRTQIVSLLVPPMEGWKPQTQPFDEGRYLSIVDRLRQSKAWTARQVIGPDLKPFKKNQLTNPMDEGDAADPNDPETGDPAPNPMSDKKPGMNLKDIANFTARMLKLQQKAQEIPKW